MRNSGLEWSTTNASITKTHSTIQKKTSMKTACTSRIAFLKSRVSIGFALYAAGPALAFGIMSSAAAGEAAAPELNRSVPEQVPGRWKVTGSMTISRIKHTTTLLRNGTVLAVGGDATGSAELYNPSTGVWTATGSMTTERVGHTATLLRNGQVLAAGGGTTSAELYNPATGMWTATGSMTTWRYGHTATLLPNGQVLVAGGAMGDVTKCRTIQSCNRDVDGDR